jgi:16S rRNA processing protein RimM
MGGRAESGARRSGPRKAGAEGPLVCVGVIAAAHGIKGEVKVKSFTQDAESIAAYGPLWDEGGTREFALTLKGAHKGALIAAISGVTDRNEAEALKGTKLYVPRSALPEPEEGEFYYADLVGLRAELADGTLLGTVVAVHNFGAGDVIEVKGAQTLDIPFTAAVVPVVDIEGGRIVIEPPEGLLEAPEAPKGGRHGR